MPDESDRAPVPVDQLFRAIPSGRAERWSLLRRFFEGWFGGLGPTDGCSAESMGLAEERLGVALPAALREWYALAGQSAIWSMQDHFLGPEGLRVEGDKLILSIENQNAVRWGIPLSELGEEDPPVFVSEPTDSVLWIEETPSVSLFALSQAVLNATFSGATAYCANGQATDDAVAAIEQSYARLGFPDLHWPPHPTRMYGGVDLIVEVEAETWIWVSGRSPATFRGAVDLIAGAGVEWEQVIVP
jgi:hypothetical protein